MICLRSSLLRRRLERRDGSRLMVLDKKTGATAHRLFYDIPVAEAGRLFGAQ